MCVCLHDGFVVVYFSCYSFDSSNFLLGVFLNAFAARNVQVKMNREREREREKATTNSGQIMVACIVAVIILNLKIDG